MPGSRFLVGFYMCVLLNQYFMILPAFDVSIEGITLHTRFRDFLLSPNTVFLKSIAVSVGGSHGLGSRLLFTNEPQADTRVAAKACGHEQS